ncbi:MAG: CAP domain-containing protein [Actinomycetota bacterium]
MRGPTSSPRSHRAVIAVAIACLVVLSGPANVSGASPETDLRRLINMDRKQRDLRPLKGARKADRLAEQHSRRMARSGQISPSRNLPRKLENRGYRFRSWAQNVGCHRSVRRFHRATMRRRSSRKNVLGPRFRRVGIGVARTPADPDVCNGATVWVTEIFFG